MPSVLHFLTYGAMEGDADQVESAWVESCQDTRSVVTDVFYEGTASLLVSGRSSSSCFVTYLIGPDCAMTGGEDLEDGDTVHLSFQIRSPEAGAIVEVLTGHKSAVWNWKPPDDDSHMVVRSKISNANEWTSVEASYLIGPSWKHDGVSHAPDKCHYFQLRFSLPESTADFYLDDVRMVKQPPLPESSVSIPGGIMQNPKFDLGTSFWNADANQGGYVTYDEELGNNALVLEQNDRLFQYIHPSLVSGSKAQLSFWVKMTGVQSFDLKMELFLRFANNDLVGGPCTNSFCSEIIHPINKIIDTPGEWKQVFTDPISIWDFDSWDGEVTYVYLTINGPDEAGSSLSLANFGEILFPCTVPSFLRTDSHNAFVLLTVLGCHLVPFPNNIPSP